MADTPASGRPVNSNPDYQDRDILVKPIVWFVVGLLVLTLLIVAGMGLFFYVMELRMQVTESTIPPAARERQLPPADQRLLVDEQQGLVEYLEKGRLLMESTAIVDAENGIARIPVAVAMERVAAGGIPRWSPPVTQPAPVPVEELPPSEE